MSAPHTPTTDPARIRALAHPLRLEMLDLLNDGRELTATECAGLTGESVASCSFHLRMLAKYGYIEAAPRRGREKPWRLVSRARDMRPSPDIPGSLAAVTALAEMVVLREGERMRRFLAQAGVEDDAWIQASTIATIDFWATAEELADVSRRIHRIVDEYTGRDADPGQRPEGTRHSRIFAAVNPDPASKANDD